MKNAVTISALLMLLYSFNPVLWANSDNTQGYGITAYTIDVEIFPVKKSLRVDATIRVEAGEIPLDTLRLFLHETFTIDNILIDGQPLNFVMRDHSVDSLMFSPTSIPVDIALPRPLAAGDIQEIKLTYMGHIQSVVWGVNLISEHLTELAIYCSWYPLVKESVPFTYTLEVTLPAGQTCVTDGDLISQEIDDGKTTWHYQRKQTGNDIPVIASDQFKVKEMKTAGIQASIYYKALDDERAEETLAHIIDCVGFYSEIYGKAYNKDKIVSVYSPRDGWGYSRSPLFVGSENYVLSLLRKEEGQIEDFHGSAHEIGHFWWMLADTETSDDWLNEGLAEFSALLAVERFYSREEVNKILEKYHADVLKLDGIKPILETLRNVKGAYVLYYEKGAMIFQMLREMLGEGKLFHVLRIFYDNHKEGSGATTQDLMDVFLAETDLNLEPFFRQYLKTSELPRLTVEWRCDGHTVEGRILVEKAEYSEFPVEMTFMKTETRTVTLSPGENMFRFTLPFSVDRIAVDENITLLKEKVDIKQMK